MNNMIGGFTNFYFFVGAYAPNYYNLWLEDVNNFKVNLDPLSKLILDAVSEYHIKILEQAAISFFKPKINDTKRSVSFNFINLNLDSLLLLPHATVLKENSPPIPDPVSSVAGEWQKRSGTELEIKNKKFVLFALEQDGRTFASFTSKLQAAKELGITLSIISRNSNVEDNYYYCPRPDKILLLIDPTKVIKQSKKPAYNISLPVQGVDLLSLDKRYYYLILEDKKTSIGKYNTYLEISKVTSLPISSGNAYTNCTRTVIFKQNEISNILNDSAKDLANSIFNEKGLINVFICCNPAKLTNNNHNLITTLEKVVSFDVSNNLCPSYHSSPKEALLNLLNILGFSPCTGEVNKYHRSFTNIYITGATAYKYKKLPRTGEDRFYLCYAKDYTNGIIPQDILISFNRHKKIAENKIKRKRKNLES